MNKRSRYTAYLPKSVTDLLEKQRLPEEDNSNLYNRMLVRLYRAIAANEAPPGPNLTEYVDRGPLEYQISFKALPKAEQLIEEWRGKLPARQKQRNRQYAIIELLAWSAKLPIVEPIRDETELWRYLWDRFGQSERVIWFYDILFEPLVCDRLSLPQLRLFLGRLYVSHKVRLISRTKDYVDPRLPKGFMVNINPEDLDRPKPRFFEALELLSGIEKESVSVIDAFTLLHRKDQQRIKFFNRKWKSRSEPGVRRIKQSPEKQATSNILLEKIQTSWVAVQREKTTVGFLMPPAAAERFGLKNIEAIDSQLNQGEWRSQFFDAIDRMYYNELDGIKIHVRSANPVDVALVNIRAIDRWSRSLAMV